MSLFQSIKNQFRSVIEWESPDPNILFYKWSDRGDEIKDASKLIVNPGQGAIFVYKGEIKAVNLEAGTYELGTGNIPFITTITKFMQAFESEHKVGIYFVRLSDLLDQKWGTKSPIKYKDPIYNFPVGMRAFGNFSFQITEPESFFVNVVSVRDALPISEVSGIITDRIMEPLTDLFAESGYAYTEIDKNRDELSVALQEKVKSEFEKLGFKLTDFRIENTDFDDDTKARINKISDTIAETEAAKAAGIDYVQMQQVQAMRDAAKNEGGMASAGVGVGVGASLGQMMAGGAFANQQGAQQNTQGQATPPAADPMSKLSQLKKMLDNQLITQEEYDAKKADILKNF